MESEGTTQESELQAIETEHQKRENLIKKVMFVSILCGGISAVSALTYNSIQVARYPLNEIVIQYNDAREVLKTLEQRRKMYRKMYPAGPSLNSSYNPLEVKEFFEELGEKISSLDGVIAKVESDIKK